MSYLQAKIEIERLIQDENWGELSKMNTYSTSTFLKDANSKINKTFLTEYLSSEYGAFTIRNKQNELLSMVINNGIELLEKDYETIFNSEYGLTTLKSLLLATKEKTVEFTRFFLKNHENFTGVFRDNWNTPFYIGDSTIDGLSEREKDKFANLLNDAPFLNSYVIKNGVELDGMGKEFFEAHTTLRTKIRLLKDLGFKKEIFQSVDPKELEANIFNEIMSRGALLNIDMVIATHNLKKMKFVFSDEHIRTLLGDAPFHQKPLFGNLMTKEQVLKNLDVLELRYVIDNEHMTLDELSSAFPNKNCETNSLKFYTEEEIARNPQFFNPASVHVGNLYFTRETHKLLNRAWKMRQRYYDFYSDPTLVMIGSIRYITSDNIRYLKTKGAIDWSRVHRYMERIDFMTPELKIIKNFLKRHMGEKV